MSDPVVVAKKPLVLELDPGSYHWCACGRSQDQPFCDGSHKGTGITPVAFTVENREKVWLCQCRHTRTPPYCDGTHKGL